MCLAEEPKKERGHKKLPKEEKEPTKAEEAKKIGRTVKRRL